MTADADADAAADLAALDRYAHALADGIEAAIPGWVVASVERVLVAFAGVADPAVMREATTAGHEAREAVGPSVRLLLGSDIDEQATSPLELVRRAVPFPTRVLREAGVPPVVRDPFAEQQFPEDDYDLTPATFGEVSPELHELGLTWGAAKAHVFLARRRAEGR